MYGLSYHRGHVYWSEFQQGSIHRMSTDQETIESVARIIKAGGGAYSGSYVTDTEKDATSNTHGRRRRRGVFRANTTKNKKNYTTDEGTLANISRRLELDKEYKKHVMTLQEEHPLVFDVKVFSEDKQPSELSISATQVEICFII